MNSGALVTRNALVLLLAQIATNALSFVTVPLVARSLGSTDYGTLYLASVIAMFAAMVADCGQNAYVTLAVAKDNARAPELFVTSLVLKGLFGIVVALPLELVLRLLGYDPFTRLLVFMVFVSLVVHSLSGTAMAVVNGLERMGPPAATRVASEAVRTVMMVLAIWLGARLRGICGVQIAAAVVAVIFCLRWVTRMRLWAARPTLSSTRDILHGGLPFVLWASINAFQPGLEGVLMSKLASSEAVGWFGAATRMITLLLFPAGILGSAVGPTAARLHATDFDGFSRAVRQTLRVAMLLALPCAVGTFLFAGQGMALIFGKRAFGPSADVLRVFSLFLLPVFINIALGTVLVAAGRQLAWTICKGAAVTLGAAASFVVIPYFQARSGNGGLGAAAVTAASEFGMLAAAFALLPRGVLDLSAILDLLRALAASAAMAVIALLLGQTPFLIALACSLVAYLAALVALGAVGGREFAMLQHSVRGALGGS